MESVIQIDSLKTSFLKLGQGKLIFLLHGWKSTKEKLNPLGESLAKRGWLVIIPDWPGFGKSAEPPVPWEVKDYARFFNRFQEKVTANNNFIYFGHSFGGRVALELGAENPDRLAGLVLCGSAGLSRGNPLKRATFGVLAKIGKKFFGKNQILHRLLYLLAREHDYERLSPIMGETFKLVIGENLHKCLKYINVPTLLLWGEKDRATKLVDAKIIHQNVKNSRLKVFQGQGHLLPYQEPEKIAEEITSWSKDLTF